MKTKKKHYKWPLWLFSILWIAVVATGVFLLYKPLNWQKKNTLKPIPVTAQTAPEQIIKPTLNSETQKNTLVYKVPILMYHYIRTAPVNDDLGARLSVDPENFDSQIKWLVKNDYITIRLIDLADPDQKVLKKVLQQNKKPIIITFDDGYTDAYTEAYKILKKHDSIGTFFVIRNFVGRDEYATQEQIDEMAKNGMEIGSHTLNHKDLAKNTIEIDTKEIFDSKLNAETFCYPSGKYNEETVKLVKEAGYKVAVTTQDGIANQDSNLFELPRKRIMNISLENFIKKVTE
ncbi:MAG: polysaccharide deacetylase family protein [Candidatus Berkelbacteria bacterium]